MGNDLTPTEIASMSEVVAKYMGLEKFEAKQACHTLYGSFDFFYDEPDCVYVKGASDEFRKHLILSNPEQVGLRYDFKLFEDYHYASCLKYPSSWDWIHEVWEKVKNESFILRNALKINDYTLHHKFEQLKETIKYKLFNDTPLEAFTALYNAIEFINNLKQQNNGNSSI